MRTASLADILDAVAERGTPEQQAAAARHAQQFLAARTADPIGTALLKGAPIEARPPRLWQRVLMALATGGPKAWKEVGIEPSCPPSLVAAISGNQGGKTTGAALCQGVHATGRSERFPSPGGIWLGAPRLSDAIEVQRPYLSSWIGAGQARPWKPSIDAQLETVLMTTAGYRVRSKAFEQGRTAWQGKPLQAVYLDEQPMDDGIVAESETRLVRHRGVMVVTMTPLHGTNSVLYKRAWEPWTKARQAAKKGPRCPVCGVVESEQWAEVMPGVWVISVGMRANAVSRGGVIPDDVIDAKERSLIEMGRPLEARVAIHGEWLDTAEDRLIPADRLIEHSYSIGYSPPGGWADVVGWIDTAHSTKPSADETAIAIWGRSQGDEDACGYYQLASEHGRWEPDTKLRIVVGTLIANGCPNTFVDQQNGDLEFADSVNRQLTRKGGRPCVQVAPHKTLNKVVVANLFAPMVAARRVFVKREHLEGPESFGSQARLFSASYRGHDDTLDAGMKGCLALVGSAWGYEAAADAMAAAEVKHGVDRDDDDNDDEQQGDWRMDDSLLGSD